MDCVKLHVIFFCFGCVLSMCLTLDCDWSSQYEYNERCCQLCPSGTYPKQHCYGTGQSVCVKCQSKENHCFCNNHLCENTECSDCAAKPQCKPGEERIRTGSYKFTYSCRPFPTDKECKTCQRISEKSGNTTGNARRGTPETARMENGLTAGPLSVTKDMRQSEPKQPVNSMTSHASHFTSGDGNYDMVTFRGLVVGLSVMSLAFLAMFIYLCIRRMGEERKKIKRCLTSSSLKVSSDECVCKLSKEEIGEA